jgi:hypothetical protein
VRCSSLRRCYGRGQAVRDGVGPPAYLSMSVRSARFLRQRRSDKRTWRWDNQQRGKQYGSSCNHHGQGLIRSLHQRFKRAHGRYPPCYKTCHTTPLSSIESVRCVLHRFINVLCEWPRLMALNKCAVVTKCQGRGSARWVPLGVVYVSVSHEERRDIAFQ